MGSLPQKKASRIVAALAQNFGIPTFVETGTYQGETTRWAAGVFEQVITIEIDSETAAAAQLSFQSLNNIRLIVADSAKGLSEALKEQSGPLFFWLDAHKGGGYFGSGDDCPLLQELDAIATYSDESFIFIDDARGFLAPPPPPFNWRIWPDIRTVIDKACGATDRYCVIHEDVIMCVPRRAQDALRDLMFEIRPKL